MLADISKIIDEARAKGADFSRREYLLACANCGVYEDEESSGRRVVKHKETGAVSFEPFIIIDEKTKSFRRNHAWYYKIEYTFICSVCGVMQKEIIRDKIED